MLILTEVRRRKYADDPKYWSLSDADYQRILDLRALASISPEEMSRLERPENRQELAARWREYSAALLELSAIMRRL